MNIPLVDLKAQYARIQPDIDAAMAKVLAETDFIMGKAVKDFEAAFADFLQVKRVVGVSNGTDALHLTLLALGVGAGDEVITTPHTFIATVEPIIQRGARPVFVDIDPATFNLNPALLEAAITPRTRAIMPVHLYGQPADMRAILEIADRHGIPVIEDAAQAHGAEYQGKRIGNWGRAACFSFYPGKNLGAYGDAGGIATNDEDLANKIAKLRNHGRMTKYEHEIVGYGNRLDTLQAAVLLAKLPYLEEWTEARRRHAAYYDEMLKGIPGLMRPAVQADTRHVYHLYVIRLEDAAKRDALLDHLTQAGIGAGIHYPVPLHLQPALTHLGYQHGDFPETERAAVSIISLPMYPELEIDQLNMIVEEISQFIGVLKGA
ncbi:MAG: DegT/DnrJ/EryC1/StrS family aminotransferase [Burkholderiales bacterium]|nr:DegT/DnrJ/EryC1/StrS family aminotransferase [Anaerolineae bacterium]